MVMEEGLRKSKHSLTGMHENQEISWKSLFIKNPISQFLLDFSTQLVHTSEDLKEGILSSQLLSLSLLFYKPYH